jgi:hypothetical protein
MTDEQREEHEKKQITIEVINEDDGHEGKVHAHPSDLVRTVVEKAYHEVVKRAPQPGDRVRCVGSGEDVLKYADMHIGTYVASHCRSHEWLFAGQTGGA